MPFSTSYCEALLGGTRSLAWRALWQQMYKVYELARCAPALALKEKYALPCVLTTRDTMRFLQTPRQRATSTVCKTNYSNRANTRIQIAHLAASAKDGRPRSRVSHRQLREGRVSQCSGLRASSVFVYLLP